MKITTYTYNEKDAAEVMAENVSLQDATEQLKSGEIHFYQIEDSGFFIEITLSNTDELITNGHGKI